MKNVLLGFLQFVVFLVAFAAASFFPPFHMRQVLSTDASGTHIFLWDGVIVMSVLFAVILFLEQVRRRLAAAGPWTSGAFLLAVLAGLALKLGRMTV